MEDIKENQIAEYLNQTFEGKSLSDLLRGTVAYFNGATVFSTSFGQEDQVISHFVFSENIDINVFTLDTGRMFNETYKVWSRTLERYKKPIQVMFPQQTDMEKLMTSKGPFSFYESIENRKECCNIRKVEPLQRALKDQKCWITGLRAAQSAARKDLKIFEWDAANKIIKCNPLLNWTLEEVLDCIKKNNIPYNSLHDQGFISIGCAPCTRAIKAGEDIRAGRWWWEDKSKKECGLHETNPNQ